MTVAGLSRVSASRPRYARPGVPSPSRSTGVSRRRSLAERLARLVLDHAGQLAGGRGERHVHGRDVLLVDVDAVHQPEIDDVDTQLRVDDVLQSLFDVGDRSRHDISPTCASARAVASLNAIHDSSAHLTRAGYFATPAKATPSSSSSSSGSTWPRPDISATKASCR